MKSVWVIGLMSGTSLDGIDAALLRTNGLIFEEIGPGLEVPYDPIFRQKLYNLVQNAHLSQKEHLEEELTDRHTQVVQQLIQKSRIQPNLIGFHGQTIYHKPRTSITKAQTLQIGNGQRMANHLGIPVVYDFRSDDIKHGGEGAPLVPIFHQALVHDLPKPLAFINIGGVSNITLVDKESLLAGDIGPGNALVDDWMKKNTGSLYDKNGQTAITGRIHHNFIHQWLDHPFFQKPLPKSLDRQTFYPFLEQCQHLTLEDGAATLMAFTAASILEGLKSYPHITSLILTGGGRRNLFLKNLLNQNFTVETTEEKNWNGDLLEAQAFAYLAARSYYRLPLSFPSTTGVSKPVTGGKIAYPFRHTLDYN